MNINTQIPCLLNYKIKNANYLFLGLFILFSACKKKTEATPVAPQLISSNPANNKQDVTPDLKEIVLRFDQKVTLLSSSKVTFNEELITYVKIGSEGELQVALPELEYAKTYTLVIAANSIKGANGVLFPTEVKLTFSTLGLVAETLPAMPAGGPDGGTYDKPGRNPAGTVTTVNFYSSVAGKNVDMLVYTPPGYSTGKKYGVIYCYQGLGDKAANVFNGDWVRAGIISDNLIGDRKISKGVIIVAVDDQYNGNSSNVQDMTITDAIPYIDSHYSTYADADHRGLFGYSWGGGYTFNVGAKNLNYFHYISPSSAAPNKQADDVLFPNDGADAKKLLKCLFISWAQYDYQGFINLNQATVNYCKSKGIPHDSWVAGGQGHSGGTWRPAMWNFLQLADRAGISK
ncbi:Ig-like domain-containing protein [Mucilaginibacter sp. UR6-1]|uniref:alpha/beta hydrolase-fold protein n=1 Tax=Mucilaginibacter sp. UR6-1 TaxID=1435643 RepID=UPI001E3F5B4F|nr:Ig-like domain-containing protein [Mucilaginibacter sp. UR6-1]MCC8408584.1 Ig-like domain-containing protein [Mucilaginibacter sp. UR6-1]